MDRFWAKVDIRFKKLHPNAIIPAYQTAGAAGMDLHWDGRLPDRQDGVAALTLGSLPCLLCTGLAVEIPEGYEGQIRPRSSLNKRGVVCYFGTIDSDYRGEFLICLQQPAIAMPEHMTTIRPGDRIAQLVIAPVARCQIQVVDELSPTQRGTGAFGSTGR